MTTVRVATDADIDAILALTNDAFMADAFFKKEEYHLRFDEATVKEMMQDNNSCFLIAQQQINDAESPCGSIFFHWDVIVSATTVQVTGKFSAVSVPNKFGKRGIGKALVNAAETKLVETARAELLNNPGKHLQVSMEMGVINQRKDLFPWYEGQGYKVIGEIRPNDAELLRICLDEVDICCVLMRKVIQIE